MADMTAEEAAAAIGEVRDYRQGLTARAAGTIWMVWGLVLGALAITDVAAWAAEEPGQGTTFWFQLVFGWIVLAVGASTTAAIWKSQALVRGTAFRSILVFLAVLAVLAIAAVGAEIFFHWFAARLVPDEPGTYYRSGAGSVAALTALAITWFQRKRVARWPGLLVALVMIAIQVAYPYWVGATDDLEVIARASFLNGAIMLASFTAAGLVHFRRG